MYNIFSLLKEGFMALPFVIALATFAATFFGGLFALKFKDKLHLILGFSAGAVLAVAFFDLLPEALELTSKSYSVSVVTSIVALGFVMYMVLDRTVTLHSDQEETGHVHHRGKLAVISLSLHSFLDGLAIGLAFKVSHAVGVVVATAVLVHDFSDGLNTVNLVLKNRGEKRAALKWLMVDALAPILGVFTAFFFTVPDKALGLILSLFCGFFTYIGASDLLPESHHGHPTKWTTISTVLGLAIVYVAIHLARI